MYVAVPLLWQVAGSRGRQAVNRGESFPGSAMIRIVAVPLCPRLSQTSTTKSACAPCRTLVLPGRDRTDRHKWPEADRVVDAGLGPGLELVGTGPGAGVVGVGAGVGVVVLGSGVGVVVLGSGVGVVDAGLAVGRIPRCGAGGLMDGVVSGLGLLVLVSGPGLLAPAFRWLERR